MATGNRDRGPSRANATAAARPIPVERTGDQNNLGCSSCDSLQISPVPAEPNEYKGTVSQDETECTSMEINARVSWRRVPILCKLGPYLGGMGHAMELRHLRYFVAVAEEGSLTGGGRADGCTHRSRPSVVRSGTLRTRLALS